MTDKARAIHRFISAWCRRQRNERCRGIKSCRPVPQYYYDMYTLKVLRHVKNPSQWINAHLRDEHFCQTAFWSGV